MNDIATTLIIKFKLPVNSLWIRVQCARVTGRVIAQAQRVQFSPKIACYYVLAI